MPIPQTLHQPITFDSEQCPRDAEPIVIGNTSVCPGIVNPNFEGAPVTDWTLSGGLTEAGNDPLNVTGAQSVTHTLAQGSLEFTPGDYVVSWDIDNADPGQLSLQVLVTGSIRGTFFTSTSTNIDGVGSSVVSETFTIPGGYDETYTVTLGLRQQMGSSPPVQLDATINYLNICPADQDDLAFCFQLPLFQTGSELLGLAEVNLAYDFTNNVSINRAYDDNGSPTACGTPRTDTIPVNSSFPTLTQEITAGVGRYFWEVSLGDVTIEYGLNPDDDTVGKLKAIVSPSSAVSPQNGDAYEITESTANSSFLFAGTNEWNPSSYNPPGATAYVDLFISAKSECDDTNERIKWDITQTAFNGCPAFYESTFTAEDDTFYRLKFDLAKTSNVTVEVKDSSGATIFEASETGPTFDKIFLTGTLPTTTVTVRFEIYDLTEYPAANFNNDVLTNITLYKFCKWEVTLQDLNGNTIATLAETHATTSESLYTVSYNKNILYCLNLQTIDAACYVMQAENQCDTNETWLSNQFRVCEDSCELNEIRWDHGGVKYMGDYCLDYTNYDYNTFFFSKISFQDLTQEWEGVYYRDARYELQNPYSAFADTQVMQVWPLPPFMRKALAVAISSEFLVDGVEYRKLDDEAITPQFNAVGRSPVRVIVQKTGDIVQSKNL